MGVLVDESYVREHLFEPSEGDVGPSPNAAVLPSIHVVFSGRAVSSVCSIEGAGHPHAVLLTIGGR